MHCNGYGCRETDIISIQYRPFHAPDAFAVGQLRATRTSSYTGFHWTFRSVPPDLCLVCQPEIVCATRNLLPVVRRTPCAVNVMILIVHAVDLWRWPHLFSSFADDAGPCSGPPPTYPLGDTCLLLCRDVLSSAHPPIQKYSEKDFADACLELAGSCSVSLLYHSWDKLPAS